MNIRLAQLADMADIAAIYDREVLNSTATFDSIVRTPAEHQQWFDDHPADRYPILVAESDASILGWASLSRWSPRRGYDRAAEVSVYVHQDSRGEGHGKALLRTLVDEARRLGFGYLVARIEASGTASLGLHRAVGFTAIGTMHRVGEKFGRVLDVVLMEQVLS